MNSNKRIIQFVLPLLLWASCAPGLEKNEQTCKYQKHSKGKQSPLADTPKNYSYNVALTLDTLSNLLEKAAHKDSMTFYHPDPFVYFQSGNFLNSYEKTALYLYNYGKGSRLVLYTRKNQK